MLGGNLGSLLYGDVSVMLCLAEAHNRTEVGFEQPTFRPSSTIPNIYFKNAWQIKVEFYVEPPCVEGTGILVT